MKSAAFTSVLIGLAAASQPTIFGLGSSYAAGPGLTRPIGRIIADNLNSRTGAQTVYAFNNVAQSGSTLSAVYNGQAQQLSGQNVAAAYLVSGGNDLNYVGCLDNPDQASCANPEIDEATFVARYTNALNAIRDNTANVSPPPPIFAVTYITAIGADTTCGAGNAMCPLNSTAVANAKNLYTLVVDHTVTAVNAWRQNNTRSLIQISMRANSVGHDIGSSAPWINGAQVSCSGAAWHPNDQGAIAVAGYINQTVGAFPL